MLSKKKSSRTKGRRIAVAMSGGVDSSLAAALLARSGHDIVGVTFRMWPRDECGSSVGRACCNLEAITRSRAVAEVLGIPYYVFDLSGEFKDHVIDYFCSEYLKGLTPNPCIVCNEKIKFDALAAKARSLDAHCVATGHYAIVERLAASGRYALREGADKAKDQSYFLCRLSQEQLRNALFPLGGLTKAEVRALAKRYGLGTFAAVSSQDVCFTRDAGYAEYIRKKTGARMAEGDIVDGAGRVLGRHKGIASYTIGQRRGLGIAHTEPLYVTGLDPAKNRVVIGTKQEVLKTTLHAGRLHWMAIEGIEGPLRVMAKIRYNAKKAAATVTRTGADTVRVDFDRPQEAPTPGQAVVFYDGDMVLGSGWITKA